MFPTLTPPTAKPICEGSILPADGQDILRAVENDWRRMCGNATHPAPLGPDPFRMDLALPFTFILQRTAPGAARIRVAGQKLHDMAGLDPRGMSFETFFSDGTRETAMELVEAALTLPATMRIPLQAPRGFGRKPLRGEALLLPLRDAQGGLTRIMGVIVSEAPLPQKAIRWEMDPKRSLRCEALDGPFPDRRTGPRAAQKKAPVKQGLRLVVDNTKANQVA